MKLAGDDLVNVFVYSHSSLREKIAREIRPGKRRLYVCAVVKSQTGASIFIYVKAQNRSIFPI